MLQSKLQSLDQSPNSNGFLSSWWKPFLPTSGFSRFCIQSFYQYLFLSAYCIFVLSCCCDLRFTVLFLELERGSFTLGFLGLKLCGYFVLERLSRWAAGGILWSGFRTLAIAVRRCFEDQKWAENWNKMPREIITLQCGQCGNQACHFPHTPSFTSFSLYFNGHWTVQKLIRKSMVQKSFMSPARTSFNLEEALQKIWKTCELWTAAQIGCRFWDLALREHASHNTNATFDHALSRSPLHDSFLKDSLCLLKGLDNSLFLELKSLAMMTIFDDYCNHYNWCAVFSVT